MDVIRQGDVWLVPMVDGACRACGFVVGAVAQPVEGDVILALGEATGHAHRIRAPHGILMAEEADATVSPFGSRVMTVTAPAPLTHEEHGEQTVPTGDYHVHIQRVYDPLAEMTQPVID